MDDMNIFVPITKIDAAKRLVYGVVTAEAPDVSGEVCDYASTKPLYQKWSQSFAGATNGKSFGNLRAMHGNVAAGKLVDIAFTRCKARRRPAIPSPSISVAITRQARARASSIISRISAAFPMCRRRKWRFEHGAKLSAQHRGSATSVLQRPRVSVRLFRSLSVG
jgi:hypothetical protein